MKYFLNFFIAGLFLFSKSATAESIVRSSSNFDTVKHQRFQEQTVVKTNTVKETQNDTAAQPVYITKRKMKGKAKTAACFLNKSKNLKSPKNIFKSKSLKWTIKQAEICFGAVSSKMPSIGQGIPPKRAKENNPTSAPGANTIRTPPQGSLIRVTFQSSLRVSGFPQAKSQEQAKIVSNVVTSALNSILPYGSTTDVTNLSIRANRTLVIFSTMSPVIECAGVACIEESRILYDETVRALEESVVTSTLITFIQSLGSDVHPTMDFQNIRINPQSLHVGLYKLIPSSQSSIIESSIQSRVSSSRCYMDLFDSILVVCFTFGLMWLFET